MGQVEDRQNHRGRNGRIGAQGQTVRRVVAALVAAGLTACAWAQSGSFDQARAWKFLTDQASIGPRYPGSAAHKRTRDYIVEESLKHCESVAIQPFQHRWSQTGTNVQMWNVIGYQNWEKAKTRVLLIAHWDTRPTADMEDTPDRQMRPIIGASDGASGVAVLLELMRVLKGANPDLGIQYLFVDGEDLGPGLDEMFLGAEHYAKNLPLHKPQYGILLDMVGDKDLRITMEPNSLRLAPSLTRAIYAHARTVGLESTFPSVQGDIPIQDDHLAINAAGIPTIDLIDFDYEHWHKHTDTPENCSPESLGKVGKLLETWFRKRPLWTIN